MSASDTGPIVGRTRPPYYAVVLTTVLSTDAADLDGYADAAAAMLDVAKRMDGFLGIEYARDVGCGISVTYWRDLGSLRAWRTHAEHVAIQRVGQERYYTAYRVRVALVEREYEWTRGQPMGTTPDLVAADDGGSQRLLDLVEARRGHFLVESGHHGELWLELDGLFSRPVLLAPFLDSLAARLTAYDVDVVCGPLTGGAFVGYGVAARLGAAFCHAERTTSPTAGALYSAGYELRGVPADGLDGRRVAVVDDAVNAGSAVRSTLAGLRSAGAVPVAVGALLALGSGADELANAQGLALETVTRLDNTLWEPAHCPRCAAGEPLTDLVG